MKICTFYKRYPYSLLVVLVSILGFFSVGYGNFYRSGVEELIDGSNLLCERKHKGDYFFIGRSEEKIITGYRINVTGEGHMPLAYIITWRFRDENGEYVETNIPTKIVSEGYEYVGDATYAREVAVRHLNLEDTNELFVDILMHKYEYTEGAQSIMMLDIEKELNEVADCRFSVR